MSRKPPRFSAPDVGAWELDASHFDRPFARYGSELYARGFTEGQARAFARVGMPMKNVRVALVHGLPYLQLTPLVGKPTASAKLPPRWLFRLLFTLHPALRRRYATARRWLRDRGWRDDLRRWDEEVKPQLSKRFEALQNARPDQLSDAELVDHLEACREAMLENLHAHFDTNPPTFYPVGAWLRYASEWTALRPSELLEAIQGTRARDRGDEALHALAHALCEIPESTELLDGGRTPAQALDELRRRDDALGEAARRWLQHVEPRLISVGDLASPTGAEVPDLLVEQLRHAVERHATEPVTARTTDVETIRARVPEEHRQRFDELLAEARLVYRMRDERSTLLDCWAFGLLRRALVEAGHRLAKRGRLQHKDHVVDLEHEELVALLRGACAPGPEDIAERTAQRSRLRIEDAPQVLGAQTVAPPPPLDYFPGPIAEMLGAIFCYLEHMEKSAQEPSEPASSDRLLRGLPASGGVCRGPARVVTRPEDFGRVKPGDVLIARATMPAYNVLLPIVAGIVTDCGGALCHAAIVSREYGIPCVVGTREATRRIEDGQPVVVDGDAGTVQRC